MTGLNTLMTVSLLGGIAFAQAPQPIEPMEEDVTQGALRVNTEDGIVECPLKHTDVKASISGFIARVTVTQTFDNPFDENIEAVYVFPLPHTAAVDDMTMVIGERRIVGLIKRRDEARAMYEQAIKQGSTASLLEQERPNIFTQSVGNIKPGKEIHIEISYVDVLNYDMGTYEFHFPMVVGPRYIPGAPISKKPELPSELKGKVGEIEETESLAEEGDASGTGWSPDTTRVTDASRMTPPTLKPGYRTGHEISLSVSLEAGVPIEDLKIINHKATIKRTGVSSAAAEISPSDSIPNKDFVMKYAVAGEKPEMAVLAHSKGADQGYFMLMIQPKLDAELAQAPPRDLVFLVDASGSMSGKPLDKVKEAMHHFFRLSKTNDTVQVITFANGAEKLFEKPLPATQDNVERALHFTQQIQASGGTEMLTGIQKALQEPADPERVRIVVMLTDGFVGNDAEIIKEVGKRAGDQVRFWVIGVGSSPNRFLSEGVAKQGGGMSGILELDTDPKELVSRIVHRIHRAQLANIQIDWNDLSVYEIFPRRIPELWAGSPVILHGRYAGGGETQIELSGAAEGKPLTFSLNVTLPNVNSEHGVLSTVWARKKIEDISAQMYYADTPEVVEEITRVALTHRLMSQYTSFVAVDESEAQLVSRQVNPPRQVVVPVPMPAGTDFEGVFGSRRLVRFEADFADFEMVSSPVHRDTSPSAPMDVSSPVSAMALNRPQRIDYPDRPSRRMARRQSFTHRSSPTFLASEPARVDPPIGAMMKPSVGETSNFWEDTSVRTPWMRDNLYEQPRFRSERVQTFARFLFDRWSLQRNEEVRQALAQAEELQKCGNLEAARLRYQHVLGLLAGIDDEDEIYPAAARAIFSITEEIGRKRAETHPRLNRKLDLVIRHEPLGDAIHTVVNAGGFELDLIAGSLEDAGELLNLTELRVTFLDLRNATVIQALDWLLAPYHLTWEMKGADTITVGTSRRLHAPSTWGYEVAHLTIPSETEFKKFKSEEDIGNALGEFLEGVRIVIDQKDDTGLNPGSAVLIDSSRLLVYGEPHIHAKVKMLLEALRDNQLDIAATAGRNLSKKERTSLKALQELSAKRWEMGAEDRKQAAAKGAREHAESSMDDTPWQLLAEAVRGSVDLEALTILQSAWDNPRIGEIDSELLARAAWCIGMAARAIPDDTELATLAEKSVSTVKAMKLWKPKDDEDYDDLAPLYAALLLRDGGARNTQVDGVVMSLVRSDESSWDRTTRLIAQGWLSASAEVDRVLTHSIATHEFEGDDSVLLASLLAKRRGGQLWQTFREEMPSIVGKQPLNGHVVVLVNRLESSPLAFGSK